MNIQYVNKISVEEYNALRVSAGWATIHPEQAEAGLAGSTLVIAAKDGEKTVGIARLLTDGGYTALIKDVLVLPDYQKKGISTAMMTHILKKS